MRLLILPEGRELPDLELTNSPMNLNTALLEGAAALRTPAADHRPLPGCWKTFETIVGFGS